MFYISINSCSLNTITQTKFMNRSMCHKARQYRLPKTCIANMLSHHHIDCFPQVHPIASSPYVFCIDRHHKSQANNDSASRNVQEWHHKVNYSGEGEVNRVALTEVCVCSQLQAHTDLRSAAA